MKPKDTIKKLNNKRNLMDEAYSEFKDAQKFGNLEQAVESLNNTLKHASSILNISLELMTKEIEARKPQVVLSKKDSLEKSNTRHYAVHLTNSDLKTVN